MKKILFIAIFISITIANYAQKSETDILIEQGITYHNSGHYDKAIAIYKQVLKSDKENAYALYELAYTYYFLGDYKNAVKYSKKAIKIDKCYIETYILLGNVYDITGKTDEALKCYEQGLTISPNDYMLNYNAAIVYNHSGNKNKTTNALMRAINKQPSHKSSHFLLGTTMVENSERIKGIMALYYFLFLEPNTERSANALDILSTQLELKKADNQNNMSINSIIEEEIDVFRSLDLSLQLLAAGTLSGEKSGTEKIDYFIKATEFLFHLFGENSIKYSGFWWDIYADYFAALAAAGHTEAFCYYICQNSGWNGIQEWFDTKANKLNSFAEWIELQNTN